MMLLPYTLLIIRISSTDGSLVWTCGGKDVTEYLISLMFMPYLVLHYSSTNSLISLLVSRLWLLSPYCLLTLELEIRLLTPISRKLTWEIWSTKTLKSPSTSTTTPCTFLTTISNISLVILMLKSSLNTPTRFGDSSTLIPLKLKVSSSSVMLNLVLPWLLSSRLCPFLVSSDIKSVNLSIFMI